MTACVDQRTCKSASLRTALSTHCLRTSTVAASIFLRVCALCGSNRVANSGLTGSETGNKDCAVAREPEETRGSQTRDSEGQTDGGVTDSTDRDSRQEKQQDCGNHKEGEGRPGHSQMERAMARKGRGEEDLSLTDGGRERGYTERERNLI